MHTIHLFNFFNLVSLVLCLLMFCILCTFFSDCVLTIVVNGSHKGIFVGFEYFLLESLVILFYYLKKKYSFAVITKSKPTVLSTNKFAMRQNKKVICWLAIRNLRSTSLVSIIQLFWKPDWNW